MFQKKQSAKLKQALHKHKINLERRTLYIPTPLVQNSTVPMEATPLHMAAYYGNKEACHLLLKQGADINSPGFGNETPLHISLRFRHEAASTYLIKNGADLNAQNFEGNTPLHLAIIDNVIPQRIIFLLIQKGASTLIRNHEGRTALDYAQPEVKRLIEQQLLQNNLLLEGAREASLTKIQSALTHGAMIDTRDARGNTPLHLLAGITARYKFQQEISNRDQEEAARYTDYLLRLGANPRLKNTAKETPPYIAAAISGDYCLPIYKRYTHTKPSFKKHLKEVRVQLKNEEIADRENAEHAYDDLEKEFGTKLHVINKGAQS